MDYVSQHIAETAKIIELLDKKSILNIINLIEKIKNDKGRLFFIGVGGSAANCSHAVNDFRKLAGVECYAPTDNVSELTARTNDEGWDTVFSEWLRVSNVRKEDGLFVLSVGGGNNEKNVSVNIINAINLCLERNSKIMGIVGRDDGHLARQADSCVVVPNVNPDNVTPHSEAFQAVIWHLIVSHPKIKSNKTKW